MPFFRNPPLSAVRELLTAPVPPGYVYIILFKMDGCGHCAVTQQAAQEAYGTAADDGLTVVVAVDADLAGELGLAPFDAVPHLLRRDETSETNHVGSLGSASEFKAFAAPRTAAPRHKRRERR